METAAIFRRNLSKLASLTALAVFLLGFIIDNTTGLWLRSVGLFAFAGGFTNWLAIHMLFEKVPLFYGSGVILRRFGAFKASIHQLLLQHFFSKDNLTRLLKPATNSIKLEPELFDRFLDYDQIAESIVNEFSAKHLGGLIGNLVGDSFAKQFIPKVSTAIRDTVQQKINLNELQQYIAEATLQNDLDNLSPAIANAIALRLDELSPQQVKKIAEQMIREHLGWLVVWGAFFGALFGIVGPLLLK